MAKKAGKDAPHQAITTLDLAAYFPSIITAITNRWARESAARYAKMFNVTLAEWRLMALMAVEPWVTAPRIDVVIGMDKASVSRSIRLLEHRGLARTRPGLADPRRREMALTLAGRALQSRIAAEALAREARMLDCLNPDERQTLIDSLTKVRANMIFD